MSALSLAYLTTVLALTFPLTKHGVVPAPEQQKLSILLHQYVLTWVPLVYTTSAVALGGTYFITTWNTVVLLGAILAWVEDMAGTRGYEDEEEIGRQRRQVRGVHYDAWTLPRTATMTLRTATSAWASLRKLSRQRLHLSSLSMANPRHQVKSRALDCPAFSCSTARYPNVSYRVILLLAMNQTLTDGASPSGVYAAVSMLALLIVLPLALFSMNMHRWLNSIILIIFIPRDPHNCVAFVSFAHRPHAAGGAFYDYTSSYGAVRQEDRITL
ncbi:hypothetical protein EV424DRAFT_745211 [Suillus variegatus]|nr:hypothetical protein EV424DRAFT_745211 [Suillus variegatus]